MTIDQIILILSIDKYKSVRLSAFKDLDPCCLSFLESFEAYINREKYFSIAEKIYNTLCFTNVSYVPKPIFPKEEHDYIINYLEKKLNKCKSGSDKYLETLYLYENIKACNFDVKVTDSFISYKFYEIKKYENNTANYNKYLSNVDKAKEIDKKLNMPIEEFIKEYA